MRGLRGLILAAILVWSLVAWAAYGIVGLAGTGLEALFAPGAAAGVVAVIETVIQVLIIGVWVLLGLPLLVLFLAFGALKPEQVHSFSTFARQRSSAAGKVLDMAQDKDGVYR